MKLIIPILFLFLLSDSFIAQEKKYERVKMESQYSGYWKLESFTEDDIGVQFLKDIDPPGGYYLKLKGGTGYLSSYVDEWGASIDFGFSYEMTKGKFKAVYDNGVAVAHVDRYKGTEFSFKLFYAETNEGKFLKLITSQKEEFVFIPY